MARRKQQGRKVKPVYYVFCEGETEEEYIKFLKGHYRIPIEISCKKRNSITDKYIKSIKKGKPSHAKDKTFAMYDLDKADTRDKILNLDAELLCSNPCIELWFLLHFKSHSADISTEIVLQAFVRKYPNYKKGKKDENLFRKFIENAKTAVTRAKKLIANDNPSSTVYKFIELLELEKR